MNGIDRRTGVTGCSMTSLFCTALGSAVTRQRYQPVSLVAASRVSVDPASATTERIYGSFEAVLPLHPLPLRSLPVVPRRPEALDVRSVVRPGRTLAVHRTALVSPGVYSSACCWQAPQDASATPCWLHQATKGSLPGAADLQAARQVAQLAFQACAAPCMGRGAAGATQNSGPWW